MTRSKYLPYLAGWQALVGAWLVFAPFLLGFADHLAATVSSIVSGAAALLGAGVWYWAETEAAPHRQEQQKAA